jgi:glycosyltransferase involved in cell wall biosynthesis
MVARALPVVDRGGIQTHVWELARALSDLGVEVTLYLHKAPYPDDLPFEVVQVPFIAAPRLTAMQYVTASWMSALLLKDRTFDVVHGHSMYGWGPAIGGFRPCVLTCHGTQLNELRCMVSTAFDPYHIATDFVSYLMERWAAGRADRIITMCQENSRDVHEQYGVPEGIIRAIPPGIHPERFSEARPEGPLVLSVGRLYPRKGLGHLLRAMPEVRARVPGARLLVAGRGESEGELRALAKQLDLGDAVEFLGHVPDDALPALYSRAAVFAMPSIYEGFGLVMLEAMASALPVVAFRTGGAPELVRDGETGYLADPATLGDRLARVLEDRAKAREMGRRAREEALAGYTWRSIAGRTLAVYGEAIAAAAR